MGFIIIEGISAKPGSQEDSDLSHDFGFSLWYYCGFIRKPVV
jgi:hypothetical protein